MANTESNGNILYIDDPNSININANINNSIPNYEDMFIFAELIAERKGRSVISNDATEISTNYELKINMMGINQNKGNPNEGNFTTNYYDGSTLGGETQYESFGIESIKIKINSSFVPEINIKFVDLRGLSFFNNDDSPYRILFDFPPPIFTLRIKGYYGRTLEYKIHLVEYSTEFNSDNGNFYIDAKFIALTFAPLSDVLFRYIINFPLLEGNVKSSNPDLKEKPNNTNDLITKTKRLYNIIEGKIKESDENKEYVKLNDSLRANASLMEKIAFYSNSLKLEGNIPYLFVNEIETDDISYRFGIDLNYMKQTPESANIRKVELSNYNEIIKSLKESGVNLKMPKRLCIGYISNTSNSAKLKERLNNYKGGLFNSNTNLAFSYSNRIVANDIPSASTLYATTDLKNNTNGETNIEYAYIDITEYYVKLYKSRWELGESKGEISEILKNKINAAIEETLGMKPTIYNIFKIILDDVDFFFKKMREVSALAETHHENYATEMVGRFNDEVDKIYAYPLHIENQEGSNSKIRTSPVEISNSLTMPMPEITLIKNVIETFTGQKYEIEDFNKKEDMNDRGINKWIPISPQDSILASTQTNSPYYRIDPADNEYVSNDSDIKLNQIMKIFLYRFYVLTQYSFANDFYSDNIAYADIYGETEAINLLLTLNNSDLADNMLAFSEKYKNDLNSFYIYIEEQLSDVYNFNGNVITSDFVGGIYNNNSNDYFIDKSDSSYKGFNFKNSIIIGDNITDNENPLHRFDEIKRNKFKNIFYGNYIENAYKFTKENLILIEDAKVDTDKNILTYNNLKLETRFVGDTKLWLVSTTINRSSKEILINDLLLEGNSYYRSNINNHAKQFKNFGNVVDVWVDQLSKHDTEIENILTDSSHSDILNILILSNFGYTLGVFNEKPNYLNELLFKTPAVVEMPYYVGAYIGALIGATTNGLSDTLKEFFLEGNGETLDSSGLLIFADIYDVNRYLSDEDKETFKNKYEDFINNFSSEIREEIKTLYNEVKDGGFKKTKDKKDIYNSLLNPTTKSKNRIDDYGLKYFSPIFGNLLEKSNIILYNNNTFQKNQTNKTYLPLSSTLHLNSGTRERNDVFFSKFFNSLSLGIKKKKKDQKDRDEELRKIVQDKDLLNQIYYSFKTINDKWLTMSGNIDGNFSTGYPFNKPNKNLINSFAFVDRALNPINDTIIDPQILLDFYNNNPEISVYTALANILSAHNFIFFPLQNYINTTDVDSWGDAFKINVGTNAAAVPMFICMYVGGSASYPSNIKGNFKHDGIDSIMTTNATDFSMVNNEYVFNEDEILDNEEETDIRLNNNDVSQNDDFPWRQVRAFRVRFGEQNQSMFTDIKIDGKEYPETNESIQILSDIAGDVGNNRTYIKSQNLYEVYENRSYTATIKSLGNPMIQPTQYFQLDNIPLFNGAYLILDVEHTITANKMNTSFSGTKILKYTIPRVTEPSFLYNFDGGTSENTYAVNEIKPEYNPQEVRDLMRYDSMYKTYIKI